MGSTQMLMLVLALIIVAIAIFIAVDIFDEMPRAANLDQVSAFLIDLSTRAQKYYRTPVFMAGGGNSFVGLTADAQGITILTNIPSNENGVFSVLIAGTATQVTLQGIGNADGDEDGINCTATVLVEADRMALTIVNR